MGRGLDISLSIGYLIKVSLYLFYTYICMNTFCSKENPFLKESILLGRIYI